MQALTRLSTTPVVLQIGSMFTRDALGWPEALSWPWYHDTTPRPLAILEPASLAKEREDHGLIISLRERSKTGISTPLASSFRLLPKTKIGYSQEWRTRHSSMFLVRIESSLGNLPPDQ